eukprot:TRINITY_DN2461_c0_g2_i1.p1 TRINITY_DN2461_c0_g2~~TRINITY_DN2461_c0_g2_i1.p1  ORF type:complete len:391 (-),score=53.89 TRINITY_DN2461_c0_g2_i1:188-1360(-)
MFYKNNSSIQATENEIELLPMQPPYFTPPTNYPPYQMMAPPLVSIPYYYTSNPPLIPPTISPTPFYYAEQLETPFHHAPVVATNHVLYPTIHSTSPLVAPQEQALPNIKRLLDGIQAQAGGDITMDTHQQRCVHCCNYFTEEHNHSDACSYHSGRHKTPDSVTPNLVPSAGNFKRWTCCKAVAKDAKGCKTGRHVGDEQTNAFLRRFDTRASSSDAGENTSSLESNDPSAQNRIWEMMREQIAEKKALREHQAKHQEASSLAVGPEGLPLSVTHRVLLTDTLSGVALKYGVKTGDIKRANNLIADSVFERKELTIPKPTRLPDPDEAIVLPKSGKETIAISRFLQQTQGSDKHEARYYLTEHDWNVEVALAAFRDDVAWAQHNPIKRTVA